MADEFDMDGAVDTLSTELFGGGDDLPSEPDDEGLPPEPDDAGPPPADDQPPADTPPAVRTAPQSWKKDMHEKYAGLPPEVQDYIVEREEQMRAGLEKDRGDANLGRVMRDTMAPYREMLQAQGVDEPRAVQYLLNAHYKLSNGSPEEKAGYFATLAKQYGIELPGTPTESAAEDPAIKTLRDELNGIKSHLSAGQQTALREAKARVSRDVETFAGDPAHPYFDEVADDIVVYLKAGHELDAAYEKAVWANPATRQKEIARLQQEQGEKARAEAEAARKAASNTVRSRDTRRAPTEPKGSMRDLDSSLRDTLNEIQQRTKH